MAKYIINGARKLNGSVRVQGAKNAVLPLFAAAVLCSEKVFIGNCPDLADVTNMGRIISSLGGGVERHSGGAEIDCRELFSHEIPSRLAGELRSSIFLLGSVLGRLKKAKVAYPGGCDIGLRPIDIHLKALSELNVKIKENYGYIYCNAEELRPTTVTLDYPSVGATENVILLTAISNGETVINNPAREPEIEDLQNFLNAQGAKVSGAGTSQIRIIGVDGLHGVSYDTMPDRIVAGTYLIAAVVCGGKLELTGAKSEHIDSLISKLQKIGCKIVSDNAKIEITCDTRPSSFESVTTQPYPGFPTDLQAQITTLAAVSEGTSMITENIFETRFKQVPELIKMGARIKVKDRVAVVRGVPRLSRAEVTAYDLRGGASLVIAGLNAKGTTVVNDVRHIERGYENIDGLLRQIGADIIKV